MTTQTSTLPCIHHTAPAATAITTNVAAPSATHPTPRSAPAPMMRDGTMKAYGPYGPYPPKDLSAPRDHLKVPQRINPIGPPPPRQRIDASWETVDQHWHNDKRRMVMQQREHTRYHSAWSKAFYGSPADQEAYRRHFRDVLKQQMADHDAERQQYLKDRLRESRAALDYDQYCHSQDLQNFLTKFQYLKKFRDDNKQIMEKDWQQRQTDRLAENRHDREVLRYNPINWSATLK